MTEAFPRKNLYSVQAFRGIAALLVVVFHGTQFISLKYEVTPLSGLFFSGFSGVHLFFVLSGFIIYFIHFGDVGQPERFRSFVKKRFVRIYPSYWLVLLLCGVSSIIRGKLDILELLHNASLLGAIPTKVVVPTAWTLWFEMLFYMLFGFVILARRIGYGLLALWFAVVNLAPFFSSQSGLPLILSPFNALFLFGLAIAALSLRLRRWEHKEKFAAVSVSTGTVLFAVLALHSATNSVPGHIVAWDTYRYVLGFGIASALLMPAYLSSHIENFFMGQKWLLFLGDASYSIYLVHYPLIKLLVTWSRSLHPAKSQLLADIGLLIVSGIAIAAGGLFYSRIERPLLDFLRRGRADFSLARASKGGNRGSQAGRD